ncbi:thermonuclease family protein [Candidatus Poribacteria bacterium]|nr:thermonuclease family protein [Candidatus Poribacteria bacterium]
MYIKKKFVYISFICIILAFSCSSNSKQKTTGEPEVSSFAIVTRVVDGDTIVLSDSRTIRYIGMDTPEFFISSQTIAAEKASKENENLVLNKSVRLEYDSMLKDKYGRTLAYVFVDNIMVNKELIRRGYALVYTFLPNNKYYKELADAEKEARFSKSGLWTEAALKPIQDSEAEKYIGQLHTIAGIVYGFYEGENVILLNFSQDYKTDFTIVIYKSNLVLFKDVGIDVLTYYINKKIKTFGWIKKQNGPQIIVDNPAQIEVIEE